MKIYLPVIGSNDFDAFRKLLGRDFKPKTHDEWLVQRAQWLGCYERKGNVIVDVEVDPKEFASHLSATSAPNDLNNLLIFAEITATANKHK